VVHRDIKLDNILVNFKNQKLENVFRSPQEFTKYKQKANLLEDVNFVIGDLGFATELEQGAMTKTQCGTPLYMAPEVQFNQLYDATKVDVWSLGIIFYEMLTGFVPFNGMSKPDLKSKLEKGNYLLPKDVLLSLEGLSFLNQCLQYDPKNRLSIDELMQHNYLKPTFLSQSKHDETVRIQYKK
jgi:serine/threonine protein kinase